jgi:octaprenyl-diphosphate synthase
VDESEIRRGKLSVNKKWDAKHSVLIGDFVYSKAFQIIASLKDQNIIKTLANSTNKISEGEVMQLSLLKTFISEEEYFEIIGRKTAELFQASALSAAYLAKANSEQLSIIRDLSFAIGITFQINDDLLDYFGNSSKTGKKIGQDLVEGKITLPLIKAYRLSNDKNKLILRNALGKSSKEDMDNVIKIIRSSGAIEEVIKIRDKYFLICKKNILKLPNSSFRDYLFATAKAFNNIDI